MMMMTRRCYSTLLINTIVFLLVLTCANSSCPDPLGAVLATIICLEEEDAECVAGRIAPDFKKYHNGYETEVKILEGKDTIGHLETSFHFVRLSIDVEYKQNLGPNLVGLGYVEKFTTSSGETFGLPPSNDYPFLQTVVQHEMAAVSVNDDCKIIIWDQYGDIKEQVALDKVVSDMLQNPIIQCVEFNQNC